MGNASQNFYDEIMRADQYSEKVASTDGNLESMMDCFSSDELETLAAELGISYEKKASSNGLTLEEKIAEDTQQQREDKKEEAAANNADKASDPGKEEDAEVEDATGSEEQEEAKTKQEKEDIVNPEAKEVEEKVITAGEYDEAVLTKVAYEIAAEKLAEEGYSLADYVYSYLPNEKVACFVAENAEKLAALSEKNALEVADDLLLTVASYYENQGE